MKNIILYLTFLITTIFSPELLAQKAYVDNISWDIAAQIPPTFKQDKSLGLAGAVIGILGPKLLIAGGTNFPDQMPWDGGKKSYYNDVFLYKISARGLFLDTSDTQFKLPFNLAYSAVCSTPYGIVIAGGENEKGLSKKVLLLNWKAGRLTIDYLPDLPEGLTNGALTAIENKLYLAGGEVEGGATDQFLSLDLKSQNEGWNKLACLPQAVSHTVLLSREEKGAHEIYLISGRKRNIGDTSTLYNEMYSFNVKQQVWQAKKSLPYPISAATGIIKGQSILIFSGDTGETFHKVEKLIATIDLEKDPTKKEALNQEKIKLQRSHPGFSKTVLKYDLVAGIWTTLKSKMPYGTVTTNAVLANNQVIVAGGEIRAGVRTPNIIVGKFK
ncbi:MAG TPA: hypothetical protein VL088_07290 [Pedobacter sp.]|nr:hypothetical protein [Pedobacter sp.]